MRTTITDVAHHAGVSIKTVSRVLNEEPNVTQKTRERVKASAKELRYQPNLSARSLAGSKSYLLALVYDNPSVEYIAQLQLGASAACRERGYHLVVEPVSTQGGDLTADMELLLERLPVDGVILTSPICDSRRVLSVLDAAGTPMVKVSPRMHYAKDVPGANAPSLRLDDVAAAHDMTSYLLSLGHRDIGFIRGASNHGSAPLREQGYRAALTDFGITPNPDYMVDGDYTFQAGRSGAQALMSRKNRPTAIFASSDDIAAGVLSKALEKGLRVPEDISVCGFDDTALASMLSPALTTVRQPIQDMGRQAARLLMGPHPGEPVHPLPSNDSPLQITYDIVVRGSTCRRPE